MSENKQKKGFWASLFGRNKQTEQPTHSSPSETVQPAITEPEKQPEQDVAESTVVTETLSEHQSETAIEDITNQLDPTTEENKATTTLEPEPEPEPSKIETQEKPTKQGFFSRLVQGLVKTKQNIGAGFLNFFSGKKIDDDLFEELEEQLLIADVGVPTTSKIINNLTEHASRKQLKDAELLYQQLKVELGTILKPTEQPLQLTDKKPFVILMVGVNGVGKTTTIGKLAKQFQQQGKSVMLAAGDTFRAAAVEQLQVWGERNHIPVIAQATGADSASVLFDAMQSATAKGIDILIADTAGRLQNKNNLMDELRKIVRVMKKYDETAPHEIMLTLDAGTGQNAISQMKLFNEAVGITGITLTKLDGTAKGGVIFALADQFNVPIRYIGVGEKIDDLRPFKSEEFIEALFVSDKEM
ncbi:cell division protein FtsY [Gallibacterium genomosp. 3]|uniref:Signal recognition particle receptor FtsY n=1 Tax=Gallibacterium genomosp. 3 TaxID=505345 RepID=A0A1A7NN35_9PAST|nr:signal recognition particle-docking protein FtsY [Gallibacterium genomosp. 3]OBW90941.1 cell division protein FtsY [Gallibacterium genomosp. 3]